MKEIENIETERTIMRKLTNEDAKDFYTLNLDEEVLKFTGDAIVALPFSWHPESKLCRPADFFVSRLCTNCSNLPNLQSTTLLTFFNARGWNTYIS